MQIVFKGVPESVVEHLKRALGGGGLNQAPKKFHHPGGSASSTFERNTFRENHVQIDEPESFPTCRIIPVYWPRLQRLQVFLLHPTRIG